MAPSAHDDAEARVAELSELLDAERTAALGADVDALVTLQEEKRAALDGIAQAGLPAALVEPLAERARANLVLMRHLAECLRGLAGVPSAATYGADGALQPVAGRSRGAL